jgi:hypothetical protein
VALFNVGCFFGNYDIVRGVWDVVGSCQFFYGLSSFQSSDSASTPEFMSQFFFYIGVPSLSVDFAQAVRFAGSMPSGVTTARLLH